MVGVLLADRSIIEKSLKKTLLTWKNFNQRILFYRAKT